MLESSGTGKIRRAMRRRPFQLHSAGKKAGIRGVMVLLDVQLAAVEHVITLRVFDREGEFSKAKITITVTGEPRVTDAKDGEDGEDGTIGPDRDIVGDDKQNSGEGLGRAIIVAIIAVIAIVIAVVVILMFMMKGKKGAVAEAPVIAQVSGAGPPPGGAPGMIYPSTPPP